MQRSIERNKVTTQRTLRLTLMGLFPTVITPCRCTTGLADLWKTEADRFPGRAVRKERQQERLNACRSLN
jgi:hypothetical protein